MKLGPFEELSLTNCLFECLAIDEVVFVTALTRSRRARRPATTQPEVVIGVDEAARECTFSDTTGTDQYDNERISGQGLETVQRAAWDRDLEFDESWRSTHSS